MPTPHALSFVYEMSWLNIKKIICVRENPRRHFAKNQGSFLFLSVCPQSICLHLSWNHVRSGNKQNDTYSLKCIFSTDCLKGMTRIQPVAWQAKVTFRWYCHTVCHLVRVQKVLHCNKISKR